MKKNGNTMFGENKEHEKALARCSQPVLLDKAIDHSDEVGSHTHIKPWNRRKQHQTYILSKFPNEYWQETMTVKKFHDIAPTTRSNQYILTQDGKTGHGSTNTSVYIVVG